MISDDSLSVLTETEILSLRNGLPLDVISKLIEYERCRINLLHETLGSANQDDDYIIRTTREGFIVKKTLDSILHFFNQLNT